MAYWNAFHNAYGVVWILGGIFIFVYVMTNKKWKSKPFWHRLWTAFGDADRWDPIFNRKSTYELEEDAKKSA